MAASIGSLISPTDYNALQARIATIMGVGSGSSGYNQTVLSSPVSQNLIIYASQWANLKGDMVKAAIHQGTHTTNAIKSVIGARFVGTITGNVLTVNSISSGSGNLINGLEIYGDSIINGTTISSQLTGNAGEIGTYQLSITYTSPVAPPYISVGTYITSGDTVQASHVDIFTAAMDVIEVNKYSLGPDQYSDESLYDTGGNSISQTRNSTWSTQVKHAFTVDFGTADKARAFFNSGSSIRFTSARAEGATTTQNTSWTTMLNSIGSVIFNYNGATASSGTSTGIGFSRITTTPQQIFVKTGSGSYSMNDYSIELSCDVADNTSGGARYLFITAYFRDGHTNFYGDSVSGTLTHTVNIRRATGGNVLVASPVATNTTLLTAS